MLNNKSRTINSAKNIAITIICQLVNLVLGFVVRTYFIKLLGADYLGINGVFGNILSVLSMADLGIGAAISFALYKPIAEGDIEQIKAYMNFFKKTYRVIAILVFGIGCLCIPFLGVLVNLPSDVANLTVIYLLLLSNTAVTYLCAYKQTLLIADQRNYVNKLIATFGIVLANILEILILYITHSYIGYLIMQLASTIIVNICTSIVADKYYPFLRKNHNKLEKVKKKNLFKGIKAMVIYRVAGVVLNATDNILISVLISTTVVGLYSNYTMLCGCVSGVAALIFEAIKGSVGSLIAEKDIRNAKKNFDAIGLFNFWIYAFATICLLGLLNDFITLWLGKEYILSNWIVLATVLNIYIPGIMIVVGNFRDTTGLYVKTRYVYVFAAAINLVVSIILGKLMGVVGIIFASSIARILTSVAYEPFVLFKYYFKKRPMEYYMMQFRYLIIMIATFITTHYLAKLVPTSTWIYFILKASIYVIVPNIIFYMLFRKSNEFSVLKSKVQGLLRLN